MQAVPSNRRWRHGGGVTWDDPPPPLYQGRVRSPSLRDLGGSPRRFQPSEGVGQMSCSPRTPLRAPAPQGWVLSPPNPRFIQSEGGGPGAVSSLFRNPLGGTGEGGRGGQIFRTPLLAPELSFWVAEAPGRQGPAPPAKPRLVRSEGGGHRSDGTSLSVTHRGGPARGGRGV